jgi:hypothetical protein
MPLTYEPIATQTLGSNATTVTFSSIPGTYTDLVLISVFGATVGMDIRIRFNGDTGNNYGTTRMFTNSNNSSVFSGSARSISGIQPRTSANQPTTVTTILRQNIMNYANTNVNKTVIGRYDYQSQIEAHVGTWLNTSAITSISLVADNQQWTTGSVFTLYGIKAA